jgi:hypothetical protein
MSDKEFEAVFGLPDQQRYAYFVKKVADWQVLWSLSQADKWVMAGDTDGHKFLPVWPHARFASACAKRHWAGFEPRSIDVSTWLAEWTPDLMRDEIQVAVFTTPNGRGVVVPPERLKADLEDELSLYE